MFSNKNEKYIILISLVIGFTLTVYWIMYNPVKDFEASIPGMDNRPDSISGNSEVVIIGENFVKLATDSIKHRTSNWTGFRGSNRDNISLEDTRLIDNFPDNNPEVLWKVDLGEGHAAPVIFNGRVYLLDYIEDEKVDALRCFSLESGTELWQRKYNVHIKRNHGMSRTIPAVTDNYIVTIGPKGHVMCSSPDNGDFYWGIDLVKEFKTEIPFWYTGQCPLIDNDIAIIAPGGSSLLIAVDCKTGNTNWETLNPDNWGMSHSSVMPMVLDGKKMYVYAAIGGICGISAEGNDVGEILWKITDFAPNVVAPSPLVLDNGKIFMTAGYGAGSILFQVKNVNGNYKTSVLQMFKPKKGIASEQQTPILFNGHIFTILPKDAGSNRNQFVCCSADDCKDIIWTSGKSDRFGLGPYMIADNKFFILKDDGTLSIAKATTDGFKLLSKTKILNGHDAWAPMAIADGKLLLRDSKQMLCVDIQNN
jgi:outer membrane protein assembly factor BamB